MVPDPNGPTTDFGGKDLDSHWECGSGSRRAKMTHKNRINSKGKKLHVLKVHPQNARFQNVRFQNVRFQNVRFQNVKFTKRQVYKTSGFQRLVSKRPVFKLDILIKQKV